MSFFDKLRAQKLLSFTLVLFTLSIGIVIGTLITSGVKAAKDTSVAPGATPLTIPSPVELSTTFSQIAKSVEPSVVNISTTYRPKAPVQTRSQGGRRQAAPPDEDQGDQGEQNFLYRFFGGNPFGDDNGPEPTPMSTAAGSMRPPNDNSAASSNEGASSSTLPTTGAPLAGLLGLAIVALGAGVFLRLRSKRDDEEQPQEA